MQHKLPELNYQLDALNPHISKQTLEFHHGKHHLSYVTNLNKLIPGTRFENASLEEIIKEADGGIYNNGAQVWNHTFYFHQFVANAQHEPTGKLLKAIEEAWGSFAEFQAEFTKQATALFGAGWAWLSVNKEGKLVITKESNAGNPLREGLRPLMTCDVWEHAYYLDYQKRRADYLKGFWQLVDWKVIEERYAAL